MTTHSPAKRHFIQAVPLLLSVFAVCLMLVFMLTGCNSSSSEQQTENSSDTTTIEIYAANSLEKALDEAQALYTSQNPNVVFADTQYEASGTLVEKMKAGGQPDIFISASQKKYGRCH